MNNYARAFAITGATFYPGNFNITPVNLGTMATTVGGFTHHQHSKPPYYLSPDHGLMLFFGGENSTVRAFNITQTASGYAINFVAGGVDVASPNEAAPGGMPGSFMTIACDGQGTNTGALFALQPLGDANKSIVPGRLLVYGANWDNNGTLIKLWDSTDWSWNFTYCKFGYPLPVNGKVYLPTYSAEILVLGLA